MNIGLNWHKDTVIGSFKELFTNSSLRKRFGDHLKETLAGGFIRYPGGQNVQHMTLNVEEAVNDLLSPGYPVFYAFCREFNLKLLQQLPTFGYFVNGCRKTIKKRSIEGVNWSIVDDMISNVVSFVKWIFDNRYDDNIVLWQLGNEDWHVLEGAMKPIEYVGIIEKYLYAIGKMISPDKILIVAQPGKRGYSNDWGLEVLNLLTSKGLGGSFGGVTMHVYPYFLNRLEADRDDFNFNDYCVSSSLSQTFKTEFKKLSGALDILGFNKSVKVHLTEIAIDIPGPLAPDGKQTFRNNKKNYAAAYGIFHSLLSVAMEKRFGSAAYHCLTHKYIIAPEHRNPTTWQGYSKADDWGWGQCWYLPENHETKFLNTPLLEAWSILSHCLNGATSAGELNVKSSIRSFLINGVGGLRFVLNNMENRTVFLNITGNSSGIIFGDGDLNRRVITLGSNGDQLNISPLKPRNISLSGNIELPSYAIFFAEGHDLTINGTQLVPELLHTKAFIKDKELAIGNFDISYVNGKLIPSPEGVRIENFPLSLIHGLNGRDVESISHEIFGVQYEDISEWSIGDEEEDA